MSLQTGRPRRITYTHNHASNPRVKLRFQTNFVGSHPWKDIKKPTQMSGFKEPPVGFEPTTRALQVRCSGQLSYGGLFSRLKIGLQK